MASIGQLLFYSNGLKYSKSSPTSFLHLYSVLPVTVFGFMYRNFLHVYSSINIGQGSPQNSGAGGGVLKQLKKCRLQSSSERRHVDFYVVTKASDEYLASASGIISQNTTFEILIAVRTTNVIQNGFPSSRLPLQCVF